MRKKDPTYRLKVQLITKGFNVDGIESEILLPDKNDGEIVLCLYPTNEQFKFIRNIPKCAIKGKIQTNDKKAILIESKEVYMPEWSSRYWGSDIYDNIIKCEPFDLQVSEPHNIKIDKIKGAYWITSCPIMNPDKIICRSYTGSAKIERKRIKKFKLNNGIYIKFDNYYKYISKPNNETLSYPELVATFEVDTDFDVKESKSIIDDFLLITSFASQNRCICSGWNIIDTKYEIKYYRRDIIFPNINDESYSTFNDPIVEYKDYEKFLRTIYKNFIKLDQKTCIRKALNNLIPSKTLRLESKYLTLYSSLDSIVLYHRIKNNLFNAVTPTNFNDICKDLQKILRKHPKCQEKSRRKLIYSKLQELNRVSFSDAFQDLCEYYKLDLLDLWPIIGSHKGISLTEIRNKLVHGVSFNKYQFDCLFPAYYHLVWVIGRLLITILKWPIDQTRLSAMNLERFYGKPYNNWQKAQSYLTETLKQV